MRRHSELLLGTPNEHKRFKVYDMGHGPLPRAAFIRESSDWLDRYLGPVLGGGQKKGGHDGPPFILANLAPPPL